MTVENIYKEVDIPGHPEWKGRVYHNAGDWPYRYDFGLWMDLYEKRRGWVRKEKWVKIGDGPLRGTDFAGAARWITKGEREFHENRERERRQHREAMAAQIRNLK